MTEEDWKKIWAAFDKYCDRYAAYEWDKQRKKIEQLINARLAEYAAQERIGG